MAFFRRRNRREPRHSPEFLAREAEIERLIAAEPPVVGATFDQLHGGIVGNVAEVAARADFAELDARYAALSDGMRGFDYWNAQAVELMNRSAALVGRCGCAPTPSGPPSGAPTRCQKMGDRLT